MRGPKFKGYLNSNPKELLVKGIRITFLMLSMRTRMRMKILLFF